MKLMKIMSVLAAVLCCTATLVRADALQDMKNEAKKEVVVCTVTPAQERAIYLWCKDVMYDFDSLQILKWGKPHLGVKRSNDVGKGVTSVRIMVKSNTRQGTNKAMWWFFIDPDLKVTEVDLPLDANIDGHRINTIFTPDVSD